MGKWKIILVAVVVVIAGILLVRLAGCEGCEREKFTPLEKQDSVVLLKLQVAELAGQLNKVNQEKAKGDSLLAVEHKKNAILQAKANKAVASFVTVKRDLAAILADSSKDSSQKIAALEAAVDTADKIIKQQVELNSALLTELTVAYGQIAIRDTIIVDQNEQSARQKNIIAILEAANRELSQTSWWQEHKFELGFLFGAASVTATIIATQ